MSSERIVIGKQRQSNFTQEYPLYRDEHGRIYLSDKHDKPHQRVTSFQNSEEMHQAMSLRHPVTGKDMYSSDAMYRSSIVGILSMTSAVQIIVQLSRPNPAPTDAEFMAALIEDAARQRMHELADKAGGNDAVAKLEYALNLQSKDPARVIENGAIDAIRGDANKPYEQMLKDRRAQGLGPLTTTVAITSDEANAAYEQSKIDEALDYLEAEGRDFYESRS